MSSVFQRWICPKQLPSQTLLDRLGEDLLEGIDEVDFHDTLQTVRAEIRGFYPRGVPLRRSPRPGRGPGGRAGLGLNTDDLESAISSMVVENFHTGWASGRKRPFDLFSELGVLLR